MADAHAVDVADGSQKLIRIHFDIDVWYVLLLFHVVFHNFVKGVGDVVHHNIKVHFIILIAVCIKEMSHADAEWVF